MKTLAVIKLLVALIIFGAGILTPSYSQTPEQLYQKGLMKEEGEGALQEAIDLYNQIAENSNADKSIQAKALLHIGMCYEKMGKEEATKAYQKLVNNFPSQKNEVAIARERLSKLLISEKITQDETKDFLVRKVLADTEIEPLGAPSPDGRYISFVNWRANSNLSILNLETNKRQRLTDFKDPQEQAYYSSWSPDGKKIAFSRGSGMKKELWFMEDFLPASETEK